MIRLHGVPGRMIGAIQIDHFGSSMEPYGTLFSGVMAWIERLR